MCVCVGGGGGGLNVLICKTLFDKIRNSSKAGHTKALLAKLMDSKVPWCNG